ncbi:MAG: hypothetical protein JXN63_02250 [Candidatus Delongbacteria bacterium]|nr:hypothetical protein [Candidatus Delongbacteria bacterium]
MNIANKILLLIIIASISVAAQQRSRSVTQDRASIEQRNIERQLIYASSLESRGNAAMSYNIYKQLAEKYPQDIRIIRGYLEISLKTQKIKECETRLKETALKYSVPEKYIDPDNGKEAFPVLMQGILAEFFLRTGRDQQAYMVLDGLKKANTSENFISEVKAGAFMNAGLNSNAEKIFLDLRKELKSEELYSEELYRIYLSDNRITKAAREIFKLISKNKDPENPDDPDGSDVKAELFRLFEQEEYTDSILQTAKRSVPDSEILSELYYNRGEYELSYQTLKGSGSGKSVEFLAAGFAFSLYQEKNYKEASGFFEIAYPNERFNNDREFIEHYSLSLARSSRKKEAEELVKNSNVRFRELMLAGLYHNELKEFEKADELYSKHLTSNKNHSPYWHDYIDLKIARRDFNGAKKLLKRVFDEQIIEILTNVTFYEFMHKDALLELLSGDYGMFREKADQMIRDTQTSDYDNDLLKVMTDMSVFESDEKLSEAYEEILVYRINKNASLKEIGIDFREMEGNSKKKLAAELQFEYYRAANDTSAIISLFQSVITEGILDNSLARHYIDLASGTKLTEEMKDILFSILKSSIDESLKSEAREVLRGKDIS